MRRDIFPVVGVVVAIWLLYVTVMVAKHVQAWPFN